MDITMRGLNGMAATRQITQEMPDVKVLALSMHTHSWFVGKMKEAGAKGYLLKDCASEELSRAIRTVFANQTYLSPKLGEYIKYSRPKGGKPDKSGLGNAGSTTLEARDESG